MDAIHREPMERLAKPSTRNASRSPSMCTLERHNRFAWSDVASQTSSARHMRLIPWDILLNSGYPLNGRLFDPRSLASRASTCQRACCADCRNGAHATASASPGATARLMRSHRRRVRQRLVQAGPQLRPAVRGRVRGRIRARRRCRRTGPFDLRRQSAKRRVRPCFGTG